MSFQTHSAAAILVGLIGSVVLGLEVDPDFRADFSPSVPQWKGYLGASEQSVQEGILRMASQTDAALLADLDPVSNVVIVAEVQVMDSGRANFGVVLAAQEDGTCLALRYYDQYDSLEMLRYTQGHGEHDVQATEKLNLRRKRWYTLKVAMIKDHLLGKLWPTDHDEPAWQFETVLKNVPPGRTGLLVDTSTVAFRNVRIWTAGGELERMLAEERDQRRRRLSESIALHVISSPFVITSNGTPSRQIEVFTIANKKRVAIGGRLRATIGGTAQQYTVTEDDFADGAYRFLVPTVDHPTEVQVSFDTQIGKKLQATLSMDPAKDWSWRRYVKACLDTLIEKGTDRYGPVHSPMLMSILDVYTHESPEDPPMLDAEVRTEGRPDHGRRSPAGSNLWMDTATLRVMRRMSKLTGDPKYAKAADAYIEAAFKYALKPNGLLAWGSHIYYHAFKDRLGGDGNGTGPHEILIKHPDWQQLYRINPSATRREVDGIWKWHIVDKKTGLHNRHDNGRKGCDFAFSGGSFALAFASMYAETKEKHYLDQAKLVTSWHYDNRNRQTGLTPDCPGLKNRYDGNHCFTTLPGPHASQLLRCFEITGDPYFRDAAMAHIKAYDRYGWDEKAHTFHGMLKLDGTPVPAQKRGAGYDIWKPDGHVDVWRTTMYSYEMPLIAAESAVYAYALADNDKDRKWMLRAALHWAETIENDLPPKPGRRWKKEIQQSLPSVNRTGGTYAENYGRAISFFVGLHHITADTHHLRIAEDLANEAVQKLYVNRLFRGHPAKPYYQANDGVGFLLHALMQLDALPDKWRLAF